MAVRNRKRPQRRARVVRRRKAAISRTLNPMNQSASIIETVDLPGGVIANGTISFNNFSLADFPRATQCATLYKWYKAVSCEWDYIPKFTVYQSGASSDSAPYMYSMMNRTQDFFSPPPTTLALQKKFLESQGATPKKWTSKKTLKYKPNWCSPGMIVTRLNGNPSTPFLDGVATQGRTPQFGWLASPNAAIGGGPPFTTAPIVGPSGSAQPAGFAQAQDFPLAPVYNGHISYFLQESSAGASPPPLIGDVILRVKWVFKNPAFYLNADRAEPPLEVVA